MAVDDPSPAPDTPEGEEGRRQASRGGPTESELDALGPALSEALEKVFGVLRRGTKKRVGELARKGRGRLDEYQARRDLDRLYQKLGRETIRLLEADEVEHPALRNRLERIRRQEELVAEAERRRVEEVRADARQTTPDDE